MQEILRNFQEQVLSIAYRDLNIKVNMLRVDGIQTREMRVLFVCNACKREFFTRQSFRLHQLRKQRNPGRQRCPSSKYFVKKISFTDGDTSLTTQATDVIVDAENVILENMQERDAPKENESPRKRKFNRCSEFSREECELLSMIAKFNLSHDRIRHLLEFASCRSLEPAKIRFSDPRTFKHRLLQAYHSNPMRSLDLHQELDGAQAVEFYYRNLYDLCKEILAFPAYAGRQYYFYRESRDRLGIRTFSSLDTSDVYKRAQMIAGPDVCPVIVFLSIDGTVVL